MLSGCHLGEIEARLPSLPLTSWLDPSLRCNILTACTLSYMLLRCTIVGRLNMWRCGTQFALHRAKRFNHFQHSTSRARGQRPVTPTAVSTSSLNLTAILDKESGQERFHCHACGAVCPRLAGMVSPGTQVVRALAIRRRAQPPISRASNFNHYPGFTLYYLACRSWPLTYVRDQL